MVIVCSFFQKGFHSFLFFVTGFMEQGTNAKVIVSSGYSYDPVMSEFKSFGFAEALVKPFTTDDFNPTHGAQQHSYSNPSYYKSF